MMKLYTNKDGIELLTKFHVSAIALDKPVKDATIPIQVNAMLVTFKDIRVIDGEYYQEFEVDGHVAVLE